MIRLLVRIYIFWLLFFFAFRMLFLLHQVYNGVNITLSEMLYAAFHGLRLDVSAASYIVIIPFLLIAIYYFHRNELYRKAILCYHYIIIPVCIALQIGNLAVYHAWGTLLNRRAVTFISDPAQMLASLTNVQLFVGILLFAAASVFFIFLIKNFTGISVYTAAKKVFRAVEILVLGGLIFLGIRGGWQLIPINESAAYFSSKRVLNEAATNPLWHLANNISKSALSDENLYAEMDNAAAAALLRDLYKSDVCRLDITDTLNPPNIVLLLLESFTADIVRNLNGDPATTPFFSSLCDSGLLFTNIYSSGRRTDQALPSVFSGFPAQPEHSISRFTEKVIELPFMPRFLKQEGYHLSFYYGGELEFANMRGFLLTSGFDKITGKDDFQSSSMNSKWGAHDEFVLQRQLNDLKNENQPFFSALLTLTSHEPFEIPVKNYFDGNDDPTRFRNAARYTDQCLKNYFNAARNEKWYSNTLFILIADHGHNLPRERDYYDVLSHRIPLVFYGPALKAEYAGRKIHATGAQHDLPATLLSQLGLSTEKFPFSADLLDTCRHHFAYIDLDQSLGWITDEGSFTYEVNSKQPGRITGLPPDSTVLFQAIAYRQELYRMFLNFGKK